VNVNIGCGPYTPRGWINVDRDPQYTPDVLADSWDLPFGDGTVGCVYCGHVLEHMTYEDEAPRTLREIRRVLAPGGRLLVVGPDYDLATTTMVDPLGRPWHADEYTLDTITNRRPEGEPESPGWHQWTATETNTAELVRSVFPGATIETKRENVKWAREFGTGRWLPVVSSDIGRLGELGWFIFSAVWWQTAIHAVKEGE
jgi:SAM-dependent methyltransferase